jgi:hypothetical protein
MPEMDGTGRLSSRAGRLEDVLQFSLEAQPIRPIPQVDQVELKMRILDDTRRCPKRAVPLARVKRQVRLDRYKRRS